MRIPVFRTVVWAGAGVAAVLVLAAPARAEQRETERVDRTIPFAAGGTVTLKTHSFSGTLTLAGVKGAIDAKTFSGEIDVEVTSTAEPELELEAFSGDITARLPEGANGRVQFRSFSGEIRSDYPLMLRSKSRRNLDAQLGSGAGREIYFKTFSGDVTIRK